MEFMFYKNFGDYKNLVSTKKNICVNYFDYKLALMKIMPLGANASRTKQLNYIDNLVSSLFSNQSPLKIESSMTMKKSLEPTIKTNFSFLLGMIMAGVYIQKCTTGDGIWFRNLLQLPKNLIYKGSNLHPDLIYIDKNNHVGLIDAKGTLINFKPDNGAIKHGKDQVQSVMRVINSSGLQQKNLPIIERTVVGAGVDNQNNVLVHIVDPDNSKQGEKLYVFPNIMRVLNHRFILSLLDENKEIYLFNDIPVVQRKIDLTHTLIMSLKQFRHETQLLRILDGSEYNYANRNSTKSKEKDKHEFFDILEKESHSQSMSNFFYFEDNHIISSSNDGVYIVEITQIKRF